MLNNYKVDFIKSILVKKEVGNIEFLGMLTVLTDLLNDQGYNYTYSQVDGEVFYQDNEINCDYEIEVNGEICILTSVFMNVNNNTDLFGEVETETEFKKVRISINK